HRVVIALAADRQDALAPRRLRRRANLRGNLRGGERRAEQYCDHHNDAPPYVASGFSRTYCSDHHRPAVWLVVVDATQAKFAASSVLPVPFQRATWPYGHSG